MILHRLVAEQRIVELQNLIDETFQQFALDDSEDDFDEESPQDATIQFAYKGSHPLLHSHPSPLGYRLPQLKPYSSSPALTKTGGLG